MFESNQLDFLSSYIKQSNRDLWNYFPEFYFEKSQSSIIHQNQNEEVDFNLIIFTNISDCVFRY